jgi:hypothetical protein
MTEKSYRDLLIGLAIAVLSFVIIMVYLSEKQNKRITQLTKELETEKYMRQSDSVLLSEYQIALDELIVKHPESAEKFMKLIEKVNTDDQ